MIDELYVKKDYCDHCDERWISASYLRFDQYHKPLEQKSDIMTYCPFCGMKLTRFKGWQDERKDWW